MLPYPAHHHHHGFWDSNSGPYACTASTLLAEPPLQPLGRFVKRLLAAQCPPGFPQEVAQAAVVWNQLPSLFSDSQGNLRVALVNECKAWENPGTWYVLGEAEPACPGLKGMFMLSSLWSLTDTQIADVAGCCGQECNFLQ